jgi:hypothetical protein
MSALAPVAANKAPRTSSVVLPVTLLPGSSLLLSEQGAYRTDRLLHRPDINLVSDTGQQIALAGDEEMAQTQAKAVQEKTILPSGM